MKRGKRLRLLQELRNPACTECTLCNSTINVCVMGRGNPLARIMLVGEAPGEAEAKTGKPFMGAAGKLLNSLLAQVGMTDEVYITNVNKCRPPQNRPPTPEERSICGQLYLKNEIEIVDPRAIVLLGRTAIDYLWGAPFERGRVHKRFKHDVVSLIPTWHPSYILRGGGKTATRQLLDALHLAKEIADESLH